MSTKSILKNFLTFYAKEVSPAEFYREVFPQGSLADKEAREPRKYAGRIYPKDELSHFVNDDLQTVLGCNKSTAAMMNCIAYAGNGDSEDLARELYAFWFPVLLPQEIHPGYIESCLGDLQLQCDARFAAAYPGIPRICPTYIVTDDDFSKVYFVYLLYEPLPLYHSLYKQIQRLYTALSRAIHRKFDQYYFDEVERKRVYTYECPKPRPESIFARFPVVGSRSKDGTYRAFKFGKKYDIEDLNAVVPKSCTVEIFHPTMTLEEAKELYPKWHERRIERGQKATGQRTGKSNKKLYEWFLRIAEDNINTIEPGVLEAIASFACKSHICEEDFLADIEEWCQKLEPRFSADIIVEHKERAVFFYDEYPSLLKKWGVDGINRWTGLSIEKIPRTDMSLKEHLELLSESRSLRKDVQEWQKAHPNARQADCARALKSTRKTVSKWWVHPPGVKNPCPICGTAMDKVKVEPWYWEAKGKYCARTDKKCPNCHHEIKGKVYYPQ